MKKSFKAISILVCLAAVCLMLSACSGNTAFDKFFNQGYTVIVTYNANGGTFIKRVDNELVDMYNPSKYAADANGVVSIKLTDPMQRVIDNETVSLTKAGCFVAGWYTERTLVTDADGSPLDGNGNKLTVSGGTYYDASGVKAEPAYTYGGYWDFGTDTVDYTLGSGKYELTLYACWVPYYEYNYYYKNGEEWTLVKTTTFDYKTSNEKGLQRDVVWLPHYENGAMTYEHKYSVTDNEGKTSWYTYEFPYVENTTFEKAYLDPEMTEEVTGATMNHGGTLDMEKGEAVDRVRNIYFTAKQGTYYKISTAQEFADNIDYNGYFEITDDLDFTSVKWPDSYVLATFNGKIYSTEGHTYKLSNISARFNSSTTDRGGLFGQLGETAEISNVTFENVTIDFARCASRMRTANFGLFSGYVDSAATLTNVTLTGELIMKLNGELSFDRASLDNMINVVANNLTSGVTAASDTKIIVYGTKSGVGANIKYTYAFNPEKVQLNGDNTITLQFGDYKLTESQYEAAFVETFDDGDAGQQ